MSGLGQTGGRLGSGALEVVTKGGGAILLSFLPPQTWELFLCREQWLVISAVCSQRV